MLRPRDRIITKSKNPSPQKCNHLSREINLFPRITLDQTRSRSLNSQLCDQQSSFESKKIIKLSKIFEYPRRQLTDESVTTVEKDYDYGRSRTITPKRNDFVYEPVHSLQGKSYLYNKEKDELAKKYRRRTEPDETSGPHYSSIEENLLKCDKLISYLYPGKNRITKPLCRRAPMRFHQSEDAQFLRRMKHQNKLQQLSSCYTPKNFDSFQKQFKSQQIPEQFPEQRIKSESIPVKIPKTPAMRLQRCNNISINLHPRVKEQESIFDLRRQRVNQIINSKKEKTDDPVQLNRNKLKQRGENLFNKILRVKEKPSKSTQMHYESEMWQHGKFY